MRTKNNCYDTPRILSRAEVYDTDVRCGIGSNGLTNAGNELFRSLIAIKADMYRSASGANRKNSIVRSIVASVDSQVPSGRFLKQNHITGAHYALSERNTMIKTAQALRDYLRKEVRIHGNRPERMRENRPKPSRVTKIVTTLSTHSNGTAASTANVLASPSTTTVVRGVQAAAQVYTPPRQLVLNNAVFAKPSMVFVFPMPRMEILGGSYLVPSHQTV